jgi:hypothetical protein
MLVIDWPSILTDLAYVLGDEDESHPGGRVPCSTRTLALHLGVDRDYIRRWHAGSEPRYADGEMLLVRWVTLTGKAKEFAPRTRPILSASKMRERV